MSRKSKSNPKHEHPISHAAITLARKMGIDPTLGDNREVLKALAHALGLGYPECCVAFHMTVWLPVLAAIESDEPDETSAVIYDSYTEMLNACCPAAGKVPPCPACALAGRALPPYLCPDCAAKRPHDHS